MGRPLTEDAAYAKQHGVPKRFIQRRGGAQRLRLIEGTPAWDLMMGAHENTGSDFGSLSARGFDCRRKPKGYPRKDPDVESAIQLLLRERGLVK